MFDGFSANAATSSHRCGAAKRRRGCRASLQMPHCVGDIVAPGTTVAARGDDDARRDIMRKPAGVIGRIAPHGKGVAGNRAALRDHPDRRHMIDKAGHLAGPDPGRSRRPGSPRPGDRRCLGTTRRGRGPRQAPASRGCPDTRANRGRSCDGSRGFAPAAPPRSVSPGSTSKSHRRRSTPARRFGAARRPSPASESGSDRAR